MDFTIPEEAAMIRDMMRRFVQKEMRPLEMKLFSMAAASPEGKHEMPPEMAEELKNKVLQMGLWALTVPEDLGGMELDLLSACLVEEELGQSFIQVDIGDIPPALYSCNDEQAEKYLTPAVEGAKRPCLALREPGAINPSDWKTTAHTADDGYVLNGVKTLAKGGLPDDFYLVFARDEDAGGGVTCFLLDPDLEGVTVGANGHGLELQLKGCTVGRDRVLGEPGKGLSLGAEHAPAGLLKLAARYVGIAKRLLEMSAMYARDWVALGKPLAERPAVRRMLAEMATEIEAARLMVYQAATRIDGGEDARYDAIAARTYAVGMLQRAIDRAVMIHGGPGFPAEQPALRMYLNLVPEETLDTALELGQTAIAAHVIENV